MVMLGALFGRDESTAEEKIAKAFEIIFFFALVPSAISFYSFYYFLFPKLFSKKKYLLTILIGLIISYIAGVIGYYCVMQLNDGAPCGTKEEQGNIFIGVTLFIGFIAFISGIIALVIRGFITWFEEVKQREALTQKNHEMEMALIKSQLDPHFLFNTINNIDVLILKDANKASDYLNHLSDIMRFMLFEAKTEEIPLSKEIEYIHKYIALQRIRTSNELYVDFKVSGVVDTRTIAPMVFVPFIENAFKHTNNKKIENAIAIEVEIKEKETVFKCTNKFDATRGSNQESHGLGNVLIKKRLNLIYPASHMLKLTKESESFSVFLSISHE